ncbi:TPA: hypothetical protein N0F65_007456 [Lagenidium giganteum]|uniref:Histone deacetylase domain-containing protein n=1 Tax=Lagenidium giganteum TaxID=4803 RepID=A0AAV2ZLW3_9STRA|nr:TPA: hypothetical protein N0F65_007456 [Lagenidium giganteum]
MNLHVMHSIDGDTCIMAGTEHAAFIAAGAVCDAIDRVMQKDSPVRNAFCGVRPPGHHAEPHRTMGFCFFNNVGIGARYALETYAIRRVLILDFDVHHGNGMQAKFQSDQNADILFISTHQSPCYPGTGKARETGANNNIINIPLPPGAGSVQYRRVFDDKILPAMHAFRPDLILISAGFDAHRLDPLAELEFETEDYYYVTKRVTDVAWEYAQGRVVSVLEGGYNLQALADSAAAHVRALTHGSQPPDPRVAGDVDSLAMSLETKLSLAQSSPKELRAVVHHGGKQKIVVIPDRSLQTLMKLCSGKFRKKMSSVKTAQGQVVTDDSMIGFVHDCHLHVS